ncbi:MAG: hypothetical protein F6K32_17970 [Desertifilum sp. SIO1I2]|nr:hypothetical protein [Desertifilum sp. SIO1I2]
MSDNFQPFKHDAEDKDAVTAIGDSFMIKAGSLMSLALSVFRYPGLVNLQERIAKEGRGTSPSLVTHENFINMGIPCQIMKPGKLWQSGKFRLKVTLEFCPDVPEEPLVNSQGDADNSSLSELRKQLNLENQI